MDLANVLGLKLQNIRLPKKCSLVSIQETVFRLHANYKILVKNMDSSESGEKGIEVHCTSEKSAVFVLLAFFMDMVTILSDSYNTMIC